MKNKYYFDIYLSHPFCIHIILENIKIYAKLFFRSRHHNKAVPWLKKTEYISNEFNRYGVSSEKTETKYVHIYYSCVLLQVGFSC